MREPEPRDGWTLDNEGGAWAAERRTPTNADRIREAAREAAEKARRVFGGRRS